MWKGSVEFLVQEIVAEECADGRRALTGDIEQDGAGEAVLSFRGMMAEGGSGCHFGPHSEWEISRDEVGKKAIEFERVATAELGLRVM